MKKLVMFITIFVSVLFLTNIYNVKALDNPIITNGYIFPNEDDIYSLAEHYFNFSNDSLGFKIQCWHTNSSTSEVYCFMGNISFNSWLVWNNGNYSNTYNTDGFSSPAYNWYWDSNNNTYYSTAIYKWNSDTFTWSALCETVGNLCPNNYIVSNGNQFPISFITYNSNILNSPMFRTDILYTKSEWVSPYFNLVNPRPTTTLPGYLTGYKEIVLGIDEVNVILSGLSSGSIYIPYDSFIESGGRLSYFVKGVPYQKWDTVIDDYYVMDSQFVRQDFDISNYSDASYVMFSKYLYLEGEDNITYSIYIPNDMYFSLLTAELNNNGGYDYTYEVIDENNDIQEENFSSLDYGISPSSPLLADLFSDFSSNTFGLTAIVTAPLNLISSITSSSCSSLTIPLPYVNRDLTLPCMTTIYQNTFGSFFGIYQSVTFGIISYWVIVKIFNLVKDFKNPEHDEIEVLDL